MTRFATLVCVLTLASPAFAQDASGTWDVVVTTSDGQNQAVLVLKKDGEKLSGTVARPQREAIPVTGTQKGAEVTMAFSISSQNGPLAISMRGRQDGESMKGTITIGTEGQGDWTAARTATAAASPGNTSPVDLTGTWALQVLTEAGTRTPTVVVKQDGNKLSGQYKSQLGEVPLNGQIKDKDFTFQATLTFDGNPVTITYTGTVDQHTMSGKVTLGDFGGGTFTGKKQESGGR
jgi:hypothetical protein